MLMNGRILRNKKSQDHGEGFNQQLQRVVQRKKQAHQKMKA